MCVCGVSTSASASAIEDLFENNTPGLHKTPAPPTRVPAPAAPPTSVLVLYALRLTALAICSVAALVGAKDRMSLGLGNLIGEEEKVLLGLPRVVAGGEVPPSHEQLPPGRLQPRLTERVHANSCVRAHGGAARPGLRPHLHDPIHLEAPLAPAAGRRQRRGRWESLRQPPVCSVRHDRLLPHHGRLHGNAAV